MKAISKTASICAYGNGNGMSDTCRGRWEELGVCLCAFGRVLRVYSPGAGMKVISKTASVCAAGTGTF